jgi:hypothetical protein
MAEDSGAKEMQNGRRFGRKRGAKWQKIRAQKRCKMAEDSGAKTCKMVEGSGAKTCKMIEGSGAKEMQNGRRFGRKRIFGLGGLGGLGILAGL